MAKRCIISRLRNIIIERKGAKIMEHVPVDYHSQRNTSLKTTEDTLIFAKEGLY